MCGFSNIIYSLCCKHISAGGSSTEPSVFRKLRCPQPTHLDIFPLIKTNQNGVVWYVFCVGRVPNDYGAYRIAGNFDGGKF